MTRTAASSRPDRGGRGTGGRSVGIDPSGPAMDPWDNAHAVSGSHRCSPIPVRRMEIHQLRYLVAVAGAAQFTAAADAIGVSQPSVSQGLRALENELGVALVERLPGAPPSPTRGGPCCPRPRHGCETCRPGAGGRRRPRPRGRHPRRGVPPHARGRAHASASSVPCVAVTRPSPSASPSPRPSMTSSNASATGAARLPSPSCRAT